MVSGARVMVMLFVVCALVHQPAGEKAPTWLSKLVNVEKGHEEFLTAFGNAKEFLDIVEEFKGDAIPSIRTIIKLGEIQGQTFRLLPGQSRTSGPLSQEMQKRDAPSEIVKRVPENARIKKMAKDSWALAKRKAEENRNKKAQAPGFAHLFVEEFNRKLAASEGLSEPKKSDSPPGK